MKFDIDFYLYPNPLGFHEASLGKIADVFALSTGRARFFSNCLFHE